MITTRRAFLSTLASSTALSPLAAKARILRSGGAGVVTPPPPTKSFISVALKSNSVIDGSGAFSSQILITKSDGTAYTGSTPVFGTGSTTIGLTITGTNPYFVSGTAPSSGSGNFGPFTISVTESDCQPPTFISGSMVISYAPAPSFSATLTLVNDTGSISTSGVPTKTFGWPFPPGAITNTSAPIFTHPTAGAQQFSASIPQARAYWPDGSIRFCVFSLLPSFTIPANSSQKLTITSGGSWPAASGRTTTDVFNQHITVGGTVQNGAGGTAQSWLSAANNVNVVKTRQWLDGAAGAMWSFSVDMSGTEGGARYGQLCTTFHVHVSGNSGSSTGFWWAADIRQPYYNDATLGKGTRYFNAPNSSSPSSGLNITLNGGAALAQPNWTLPATMPFTCTSTLVSYNVANGGSQLSGQTNTSGIGWYGGSQDTSATPGIVSSFTSTWHNQGGGPSGQTLGFVWLTQGANMTFGLPAPYTNDTSTFFFGLAGQSSSFGVWLPDAAGTGVFTPVAAIQPFGRFPITDQFGEYMFFAPGATTISTDVRLRAGKPDLVAWNHSGVLPPYDTSLMSGQITDSGFSAQHNPYAQGSIPGTSSIAQGNGLYIGPFPDLWCCWLYNGSLASHRNAIYCALAAGMGVWDFTSTAAPEVPINIGPNNYTGVSQNQTVNWGGRGNVFGVTGFTNGQDTFINGVGAIADEFDHMPGYMGAYLATGRPELFDRMLSLTQIFLQGFNGSGQGAMPPRTFGSFWGLWYTISQEFRGVGWPCRNIGLAAMLCPNPPVGVNGGLDMAGTQVAQYFRDVLDQNAQLILFSINRNVDGTPSANHNWYGPGSVYFASRNLFLLTDTTNFANDSPEWEFCYLLPAMIWGATVGIQSCQSVLNTIAPRWNYWSTNLGGFWNLFHYYQRNCVGPPNANHLALTSASITSDAQALIWGNPPLGSGSISWVATPSPSPTNLAFTMTNTFNSESFYQPANGDKLQFSWAPAIPGGLNNSIVYYMRDMTFVGGNFTFNLTTTSTGSPGNWTLGAAIPITNTNSMPADGTLEFLNEQNQLTGTGGFSYGLPGYLTIIYATACWVNAVINKFGPSFVNPVTVPYTAFGTGGPNLFADILSRNTNANSGGQSFGNFWQANGAGLGLGTWAMQQTYN